jgi:hypothetical protein
MVTTPYICLYECIGFCWEGECPLKAPEIQPIHGAFSGNDYFA